MIEQYEQASGRLLHLLTLEDLPRQLYEQLFACADDCINATTGRARRMNTLAGRLVVNAFFEPSTRTRLSFEIAARQLGADVVNFDVANSSAPSKGETVADTLRVVEQLGAEMVVIRHGGNLLDDLEVMPSLQAIYVNGGDGQHAHPSQALLDTWTVIQRRGAIEGMTVAILGDVKHSRVARSLAHAFNTLGATVRVAAPPKFMPDEKMLSRYRMVVMPDADSACKDADVIVCLRVQYERIDDSGIYQIIYQLDKRRLALAKPDALVLHPGPMNRGEEITTEVADGPQSCVFAQARNGVAMRMAIMQVLFENRA